MQSWRLLADTTLLIHCLQAVSFWQKIQFVILENWQSTRRTLLTVSNQSLRVEKLWHCHPKKCHLKKKIYLRWGWICWIKSSFPRIFHKFCWKTFIYIRIEIPHLWTPCDLQKLVSSVCIRKQAINFPYCFWWQRALLSQWDIYT